MAVFNIVGCGGFTAEVLFELEQIYANESPVYKFFDDSKTSYEYCGRQFSVSPVRDVQKDTPTVITISDNFSRESIIQRLKLKGISNFPNIISKKALVLPNTKLGKGNIVMPFVILSSNVHLGDFNVINSYSGLGHDSVLKSFCTLGPRVSVGGNTTIGNSVNIGQGSLIKQGLKISDQTTIFMGSILIRNTKEKSTYGSEFSRRIL